MGIKLSPRLFADSVTNESNWEESKFLVQSELNDDVIIAIGSNIYNSITKWYLEKHLLEPKLGYKTIVRFAKDPKGDRRIQICNREDGGIVELQRGAIVERAGLPFFSTDPAIVVKLKDGSKTVFVCAGMSGWATGASVLYLLEHAHELRKLRSDEFCIALECHLPERQDDFGRLRIENLRLFLLRGAQRRRGVGHRVRKALARLYALFFPRRYGLATGLLGVKDAKPRKK